MPPLRSFSSRQGRRAWTHLLAREPDRLARAHGEGAHGAQPQGVVDQALRAAVDRPDVQVRHGVAARRRHRLQLLVGLRGRLRHLPSTRRMRISARSPASLLDQV